MVLHKHKVWALASIISAVSAFVSCSGEPAAKREDPPAAKPPPPLKPYSRPSLSVSLAGGSSKLVILAADKSVTQSLAVGASLDALTFSVAGAPAPTFSIVTQNCAEFFSLTGAVLSSGAMTADKQACYARVRATVGTRTSNDVNVSVVLDTKSASVAAGYFHSCAVKNDNAVSCWGDNSFAQSTPPASSLFVAVAAGKYHSCGIVKNSQEVLCWGAGTNASLKGAYPHFSQGLPPEGLKAVAIAAGGYHTCAITPAGIVKCWGAGERRGRRVEAPHFGQSVAGGVVARSLSAGEFHTCAVTPDSLVKCWGAGSGREIEGADAGQARPPYGLSDVLFVAAGGRHSCAALRAGAVVCWGANSHGQAPEAGAAFVASVQSLSAGYLNTCAVLANNAVRCFGAGVSASGTAFPNFAQSKDESGFVSVSAGAFHTCGVSTGGAVSCWGALSGSDSFYGRGQSVVPGGIVVP
jgi:hypothetical protein